MNSLDKLLPLVLLGLIGSGFVGFVAVAVKRAVRARARGRRVVEKPNSHYTAPVTRDVITRHRWHEIELNRVHEINRGEILRLLAKVEVAGVATLGPKERAFMDSMAELEPPREFALAPSPEI